MIKTHYLASCIAACLISTQASAEVFISQYVEGGSNNKAIELANSDGAEFSLAGYTLEKFTNGDSTSVTSFDLSPFTIPAGGVLVISHSQASESDITDVSDTNNTTIASFNGDDPLLIKNAADEVIDFIGELGDVDFAKDQTLVRIIDATIPSSTFIESDWIALPKDDYTGLGLSDLASRPVPFACLDEDSVPTFTTIQQIQGDGSTSPYIDGYPYVTEEDFFVQGVVSAVTTDFTKGFYLNALINDNNSLTSEGLFINTGQSSSDLMLGDVVCVKGKVKEDYGLTQLTVSNGDWIVQDTQDAPMATPITVIDSDSSFSDTLERYEGMLVQLDEELDMRVTRTYGYDYSGRRDNMVLAHQRINMQPNQVHPAGSIEADILSQENADRRLFIESDQKASSGAVPYYADFGRTDIDGDGSTDDYIRIDDTVTGLEGVINYSYNEYRLISQNQINGSNFIRNQPRTDMPSLETGDLRVATFNVLNYFNSPYGGSDNPLGQNRGAKSEPEFLIQEAKIVSAILKLDADIVGLMEIENNGFDDTGAINRLVSKLNDKFTDESDHYKFVSLDSNADGAIDGLDSVGGDAIAVGVIYRESAVAHVDSHVIQMPSQKAPEVLDDDSKVIESGVNYQRDAIASTFRVKGGNEKVTVAVNHFKSKGSPCWEDAAPVVEGGQNGQDPDQQGSCERFRVAAAVALGKALKDIDGHTMILGDLNSYAKEDAILILTDYSEEEYGKTIYAARDTFIGDTPQFGNEGKVITENYDYVNAIAAVHPTNWSYSYNDEVGSLDYILVSQSLEDKIVDASDWHINAAESKLLDYSTSYKGDLPSYNDHFRSSDHDPAIVELQIYDAESEKPRPGNGNTNKPSAGAIEGLLLVFLSMFAFVRIMRNRK